jgi:hypothetical protein
VITGEDGEGGVSIVGELIGEGDGSSGKTSSSGKLFLTVITLALLTAYGHFFWG